MGSRKNDRTELIHTLRVENRNTGEIVGVVININNRGMMLMAEAQPEVGAVLPLRVHLPSQLMDGRYLDTSGSVRWVRDHIDSAYHVGIRFVEETPETTKYIAELVRRFHRREPENGELSDPSLHRIDGSDIV